MKDRFRKGAVFHRLLRITPIRKSEKCPNLSTYFSIFCFKSRRKRSTIECVLLIDLSTIVMEENVQSQKGVFSLLEKISFGILLGVVFLIPLFFIPGGYISVQFGSSLLFAFGLLISFILYIVLKLKEGSIEIPRSVFYFLGLFVGVPLAYVISFFVTGVSRIAFLGYTFDVSTVGFIILSFIFMYLVSFLFQSKERAFYSFFAIVVSSILFALFLVLRIIFGAGFLSFGLFSSLTSTVLSSWNSTGIFFGMTAILSLVTYEMLPLTRFMKVLVTIALLLSIGFLTIVNFMSVWIILAILALLFLACKVFSVESVPGVVDSWNKRMKKLLSYSLGVLVISLIFIFWGNSLGNS